MNEWSVAWLLHRRVQDISTTTRQNIAIFDAALVLAALVALGWPVLRRWLGSPAVRAVKPWLVPQLPAGIWAAVGALGLPALFFTLYGFAREDIPLWHPFALLLGGESALFSALLVVAVYWSMLWLTSRRWVAVLATVPWLIFFPIDLVALWTAGMRFEPRMVGWSSTDSIEGMMTPAVCALIAVPIVLAIVGLRQLRVLRSESGWRPIYRLWLVVVGLGLLQPVYVTYRVLTVPVPVRFLSLSQSIWSDAQKYRTDPVLHALAIALRPAPYRLVQTLSPEEATFATSLGIKQSPGPVPVPPAKPYRRVIFLTCESLGLNFLGRYNPAMPASLTPFLDSLPESFLNFWACSFPTNAGLASHYCSHPNYALLTANRYPNSFVRELAATGWRTVLFRSAALSYSSGSRRFTEIGFRELFGAEWQQAQGRGKYVSGWGTCDRVSFMSAIEFLKGHRDERVFLSVMTADMHFPHGRENYADLTYPEPPEWVKEHPQRRLLTAVARFDHDLSLFLKQLKAEGLWDETTLLVITADHAFPAMGGVDSIPGMTLDYYQKIPFIVLAGQPLPVVDHKRLATQTATAPTFAALLGLPALPGWWGGNLLGAEYVAPVFVAKEDDSVAVEPDIDPRLEDGRKVDAAKALIQLIETRPLD